MVPVAEVMLVNVVLSGDDCHCIVPVFPESVNVVLLTPVHTVAAPAILPDTDVGLTVTATEAEVAGAQKPLVTTAL